MDLDELRRRLPPRTTYLSACIVGDELVLVVARADAEGVVIREENASELVQQIDSLRTAVRSQLDRYARGWPMGPRERAELDRILEEIGRGPLGRSLVKALDGAGERLIWVPDGPLHGLPLQAVRMDQRYLIEAYELVYGFSGSLFVHQAAQRRRPWRRGGRAVVVAVRDGRVAPLRTR